MPTSGLLAANDSSREAAATPARWAFVSRTAALEALAPQWERLWRHARASAFLSPAWLLPWWRHVGRGELACVTLRSDDDAGELVGLAPLYVYTQPDTQRRHLFPLGIATSDRHGLLVAPGWAARVQRALMQALIESHGGWDLLEIPQLPGGSEWFGLRWPQKWQVHSGNGEAVHVLPLSAPVPEPMRRALAHARRRAERTGRIAYECADAGCVGTLLGELERLHARRWAGRGEPGVLAGEGVPEWHREAAPKLLEAGLLRLLALRLDGRLLAVLYGLADPPGVHERRWSYHIAGFDPDVAPLSPGTLLVGHAIDEARREGAAVFDFLRGDEPYKQRWGAVAEPMAALRVVPP